MGIIDGFSKCADRLLKKGFYRDPVFPGGRFVSNNKRRKWVEVIGKERLRQSIRLVIEIRVMTNAGTRKRLRDGVLNPFPKKILDGM